MLFGETVAVCCENRHAAWAECRVLMSKQMVYTVTVVFQGTELQERLKRTPSDVMRTRLSSAAAGRQTELTGFQVHIRSRDL
jgi:hypothetical protein